MNARHLTTILLLSMTLSACHSHKINTVDLPVVPESTSHVSPDGVDAGVVSRVGVDRLPLPSSSVPVRTAPAAAPVISQNLEYIRAMNGLGFETRENSRGVIVYLPASAHFDTGKSDIKPITTSRLQQFVSETNKGYVANRRVIVSGHTDSVGNNASNQTLSTRRASAVQRKLISLGMNSSRLSSQGFGETSPRFTDLARQDLNRRVEFLVLN